MADADNRFDGSNLTIMDRLTAAFLAGFLMALTLLIAPLTFIIVTRIRRSWEFFEFVDGFLVWGTVLVVITTVAGFVSGNESPFEVFSYLWGTADRPVVTVALWLGIAGLAAATHFLISSTI